MGQTGRIGGIDGSRNVILAAMSVTNGLDHVVALATQVMALRQRLAQLDAERVTIEGQIADCINRIAEAAAATITPLSAATPAAAPVPAATPAAPQPDGQAGEWTEPMALSAAILFVLRQRPEKVFTALEIAQLLKRNDRRGYSAIRTHLSRMARDGRVAKPAFGKYLARRR